MGIIYKPETSKGPVILLDNDTNEAPTITLADGTVISAVKGVGARYHTNEPGSQYQWIFPKSVLGQKGATLSANGKKQAVDDTNMSYRGSDVGSLTASSKGAVGSGSAGLGSGPLAPGMVGDYGVAPAYIGDKFPTAVTTKYDNIESAPYQYIDPLKFGQDFNPGQRKNYKENHTLGGDFAMEGLNTELTGLKNFAPQAAKLKQDVISSDNTFNTQERTRSVDASASDVRNDLNNQAADYRTYAKGEVPDAVLDKALGVNSRSNAAQASGAAGFGTSSLAAQKLSSLMSVKDRLALAQYGNTGLASNAQSRLDLNLAPTEYSNAGGQLSAAPSISGSQLQQSNFSEVNGGTMLSAATAFTSNINQSQFVTGQEQSTRTFNSTNNLQNDQFNATNQNNFALSFFNYLNSYVNSLASAGQTSMNTGIALDQQGQARDEANKQKGKTQTTNTITSGIGAVGTIGGAILGASDKNLKTKIKPFDNGLEVINKIKTYEYEYKADNEFFDGLQHYGVMAQELQKIIPDAVSTHESGHLQVNHEAVIYALVNAVKQMSKKIELLESN